MEPSCVSTHHNCIDCVLAEMVDALPKPQTDAEKAAVATELARFQPDDYQAKMAKWMFRNMAAALTRTLDEPTAQYLETVAWEEQQTILKRLKETPC